MNFTNQELLEILRNIILFFCVFYVNEFIMRRFSRFRRPIVIKSEWNNLKEVPIPNKENLLNTHLILTDGTIEIVEKFDSLSYDNEGHVMINHSLATHWQYAPSLP